MTPEKPARGHPLPVKSAEESPVEQKIALAIGADVDGGLPRTREGSPDMCAGTAPWMVVVITFD